MSREYEEIEIEDDEYIDYYYDAPRLNIYEPFTESEWWETVI